MLVVLLTGLKYHESTFFYLKDILVVVHSPVQAGLTVAKNINSHLSGSDQHTTSLASINVSGW
jgi:hypothetical protein